MQQLKISVMAHDISVTPHGGFKSKGPVNAENASRSLNIYIYIVHNLQKMLNDATMHTTILLLHTGPSKDRFNREYYRTKHLPRAAAAWKPYGLASIRGFFPSDSNDDQSGTVAICECVFQDDEAMEAAFSAPCTPDLIGDIPKFYRPANFTNSHHAFPAIDNQSKRHCVKKTGSIAYSQYFRLTKESL